MARTIAKATDEQQKSLIRLFIVLGFILFIGSGGLWWTKVYASPNAVFWGMIESNLKSFGQTRHIVQAQGENKVDQTLQLQLGSLNILKDRAQISQSVTQTTHVDLTVESISTSNANFSKYSNLNVRTASGQPKPDFSKLVGIWGKESVDGASGQGNFAQATQGAIPTTVYLAANARHEMVNFARNQEVYKVDFSKVKHERINGRSVNTYEVAINAEKYIKMIKLLDKVTGQNKLAQLDESQYAGQPAINLRMSVDVLNRNLLKIEYVSTGRVETYDAYGAHMPVKLPEKTVPGSDLQRILQQGLGG